MSGRRIRSAAQFEEAGDLLRQRPRWWPRFSSTLRSTAVTARLGSVLGVAIAILFVTGLLSHYQYEPGPVAAAGQAGVGISAHSGHPRRDRYGHDPAAAGQAVEHLFQSVPVPTDQVDMACPRAGQRGDPGFHGVSAAGYRVVPQRAQLVPLPLVFRHSPPLPGVRAGGVGHAAHRRQAPRHCVRAQGQGHRGGCPHRDSVERESLLAQQRRDGSRAAHAWHFPAGTAGRRRGGHRGCRDHFRRADGHPAGAARPAGAPAVDQGPQGVPVNRTADQARIIQAATSPAWTLQVQGPRPYALSLSDLEARARQQARLPINCVEGWSVGASWRGLSLLEVVQHAGGTAESRVLVQSFEQDWGFNHFKRPAGFISGYFRCTRPAGQANTTDAEARRMQHPGTVHMRETSATRSQHNEPRDAGFPATPSGRPRRGAG